MLCSIIQRACIDLKVANTFFRILSCPMSSLFTMENCLSPKMSDRLSQYVRPINYKLMLHPDLEQGVFQGNVQIQVQINEQRKHINLHTKNLIIENVKVEKNKEEVPVTKFHEIIQLEQLVINFDDTIEPGSYHVSIDFNGILTGSIVGFYSSRLMDSSKFQPTYTRRAFPCFDEPDFKATFDITLVKPHNYVALSNMNEISSHPIENSNEVAVTFATSVPMSTYLACFVICDFGFKEVEINSNGIGSNFILRSFAQKDQMHKIDFAQDIGKRATEYYINYYQVAFPLPKLDMIAIPDYQSGATEHWGLVTYRETSFLIDENTASATNKISVANTITHELAHMWFGNLVTVKWWNDLWLNEGFATYMQVKALNAIEPSWTMLDQFLIKTLHSVLDIDAKLSSHPIVQTVSTPDEITAIFDAISYNKGSSVLRMLEGFVGNENFQNGVTDYLKKYEYGNTITQNLYDALEPYFKKENPDLNITYIMDTWTKQMGYPVLQVEHGDDPLTYTVTQRRFLLDPDAKSKETSPFNYRWFIPITYKTNNGLNENILWYPDTVDKVTITLSTGDTWMKINNNQVGYYRVNYTQDMWLAIIKQLQENPDKFTISDRAHLLNDVFALAEAGMVSYELSLNLTTYLVSERQYVPWQAAASIFNNLQQRLLNSPSHKHLLSYVQELVAPLYAQQKWSRSADTDVINKLLRIRILTLATAFELPDAVNNVRTYFLNWLNGHGTADAVDIEPDLRNIIYYYGMKTATSEEWDKLWNIYLKEPDAQEQSKLRHALSAPLDTDILNKYLTLAWDEANVRGQDYLNVLSDVSGGAGAGAALAWARVRAGWPRLVRRYTLNSRYLGNLIPAVTESFDTELRYEEMEAFFAQYPEAGAGAAARRRALEAARGAGRWARARRPAAAAWLAARRPA